MLEHQLTVSNQLGLHARAAAQLVELASKFKSRVIVRREDTGVSANAKSILSVLHLAAGYGVSIILTVDGVDEEEAIDRIVRLFADRFGEE
jgi:phosphocarrier protein